MNLPQISPECAVGAWLEAERLSLDAELPRPVTVLRPPRQTVPIIFCSPHSGRTYPAAFLDASRLAPLPLRRSEDAYVDALLGAAVAHGAPLITAEFPRAYLDVNREPLELDPRLIDGAMPRGANTQSARVAGGLGTVPRLVADGEEIYAHRMPLAVAMQRIERLYIPFHDALAALVIETQRRFGVAILVDCHSMPSASTGHAKALRPHFVIGDRFGTSCAADLSRTVARSLSSVGYDVQANKPYAGGFITEHYGRPHERIHAIQVEINRSLYLNEATLELSADFTACVTAVDGLIRATADLADNWIGRHRVAAE